MLFRSRINVAGMARKERGAALVEEARQLVYVVSKAAGTAAAAVERAIG